MSARHSGGLPGIILWASIIALAAGLMSPFPVAAGETRPRGERPGRFQAAPGEGEITPERLERWRKKTPEERERIRERYHRWKELPPEKRERILERHRHWRELPESERDFLRGRREIYRNAGPEEKKVIGSFYRRMRELPPERRQRLKRKFVEWRGMPAAERDEQMMNWSFYRQLSPGEQRVIQRFLFSESPPPPAAGPRRSPRNGPPAIPERPDRRIRPPRD